MSDSSAHTLSHQIASRVRALRAARGLTLEALAERSGVSRSMISTIERGESSPTAALLEKLAAGLGVTLAAMFEGARAGGAPVARRGEQVEWRDPESGYVRRNVSPAGVGSPIRIVEVAFPAGGRVTYETGPRDLPVHQQVWVLEGAIEVRVGKAVHALAQGDCLAFVLDRPTGFHNPGPGEARYVVVIAQAGA